MKRHAHTKPALAAAIFLFSFIPRLHGDEIVYGLVPDSPPTTYVDENGNPTGFLIELFSHIMEELGYDYRYEVAPFTDLYPKLISGEIDLFTSLMKTPEREELFYFPDLPAMSGWGQVFVADKTEYTDIRSLAGRRIGSIKNDVNGKNFYEFTHNLGILYIPVVYDNFDDLMEGVRTGGVYAGVVYNITLYGVEGVKPTSTIFSPLPGYAVTAKGSDFTDELDAISARLEELKRDKDSYYYKLMDQWIYHSSQANEQRLIFLTVIAAGLLVLLLLAFLFNRALRNQVKIRTAQLEKQIRHDSLTGLPNRRFFLEALEELCSGERKERTCVIIIGLDHFKEYNDAHDHSAGDMLLKAFGSRIAEKAEEALTFGRLGGDEFYFIHPCEGPQCREPQCDPTANIAAMVRSLKHPLEMEGFPDMDISITGGYSFYPDDSKDPDELYRRADLAFHHGKKNDRGKITPYREWMDLSARKRQFYKTELKSCLDENEIRIYYQPKLDLVNKEVTGVEALVRWEKDGTMIPPGEFISLAEETGMIIPIGEHVIRMACRDISRINESRERPISVAVNLSSLQFADRGLMKTIMKGLEEPHMDKGLLECEITESIAIDNLEKALEVLGEMKKAGIPVAMDDFGTGYSSLAYLKDLPLDILKIDKAFMDHMYRDPVKRGIVQLILQMSRELGLQVVAEGVEKRKQLEFLMETNCRQIQGYILSPPIDIDELKVFLTRFDYISWIESLEKND